MNAARPVGALNCVHKRQVSSHRRLRQRGSAMLIVFVFAAIVAIMLYRELPVVLFEAKRQKEQLLVDRGKEYVRAIRLFYRKNQGRFPASIEQLENTNNVRYLRRRYKDPFTGKDDWRLIHAGPGGMLIDSQVNRGVPGLAGVAGMNSPAGASQTGFGNSGSNVGAGAGTFGSSTSSEASTPEVIVPDVPQRGPAVQAAGSAPAAGTPSSAELAQNPDAALLPPPSDGGASTTGLTGPTSATSSGETSASGQRNPMPLLDPMLTSPTGSNAQSQGGASGQAGQSSASQPSGGGKSSFGSSSFGQIGGGALAGIASKAGGHSIKLVENQSDYSKWEFYYDPTKDLGIVGMQNGPGVIGVPTGSTGSPGFANSGNPSSGQFNTLGGQPAQAGPASPQPAPNQPSQAPPPDAQPEPAPETQPQ